jgi:hypothetical protein
MKRWLTIAASAVIASGCGGESQLGICARGWRRRAGCQAEARPAAADEALRAVRVQRVRPADPFKPAQDRVAEGAKARRTSRGARNRSRPIRSRHSTWSGPSSAAGRCTRSCVRRRRTSTKYGRANTRPELRRGHRRERWRDPPERTGGARRSGRLDRAVQHAAAPAARCCNQSKGAKK